MHMTSTPALIRTSTKPVLTPFGSNISGLMCDLTRGGMWSSWKAERKEPLEPAYFRRSQRKQRRREGKEAKRAESVDVCARGTSIALAGVLNGP